MRRFTFVCVDNFSDLNFKIKCTYLLHDRAFTAYIIARHNGHKYVKTSSVGQVFAITGQEFAIIGQEFATIGQEFATIGQEFATIGQEFAITGQELLITSQEFAITSHKTLYRRRQQYNIPNAFSGISDSELDNILSDVLALTPYAGETCVTGSLRARDIILQRSRIRSRLKLLDPFLTSTNLISSPYLINFPFSFFLCQGFIIGSIGLS